MILGLHHIAVAVRDFDAALDGYRRLLGLDPKLVTNDETSQAWFRLPNVALEVIAPTGKGPATDRVQGHLDAEGDGIWLVFLAVDDVEANARLMARRGLATQAVGTTARITAAGLRFSSTTPRPGALSPPLGEPAAAVSQLDHLVVHTDNPERAVAELGGRLGLDLRLDRSNSQGGVRQLFFRCGDGVLEVAASLSAPVSDAPDRFSGLAWRVGDAEAAQARLMAAGFDVSDVRAGRKPGTKVFTVRDAPAGIPTLMLSAESSAEAS